MNNKIISDLLERFKTDDKVILELEKYNIREIAEVALTEKKYDAYIKLFQPIEIDNVVKIYFDYFTEKEDGKLLNIYFDSEIDSATQELIEDKIYNQDMELIKRIKVGDSFARALSGWHNEISSERDVKRLAEPACYEAMLYLFNNNVETTYNDTECIIGDMLENGKCVIRIRYDNMSPENKEIVDDLINSQIAYYSKDDISCDSIVVSVPCQKNETIGEISKKLLNIVSKFKLQDVNKYSIKNEEELKKVIDIRFKQRKFNIYDYHDKLEFNDLENIFLNYILKSDKFEIKNSEEHLTKIKNHQYNYEDLLELIYNICTQPYYYLSYDIENETEEYFKKILLSIDIMNQTIRDEILKIYLSKISYNECLDCINENYNEFYIDKENGYVFESKIDYLKHNKYLATKEKEKQNRKEMINMENIRNYDEDIMLVIDNIDLLDDGTTEKLTKEWETIRNEVITINEKYKDNEFFKNNALEKYKKIYLKKLLETDELNNPDLYEYYTLILEFLGVNSYILESEMQKLNGTSRKK